jgi:triacylglycerol lipase
VKLSVRRRRSLLALGAFLSAAPLILTSGTALAADVPKYPVNYNFLENSIKYGALPSAPGMNIWTCRPSQAHPRPVVLVHGTAGSAAGNWGTLSAVLANEGYCVFALTYGESIYLKPTRVPVGGLQPMEQSAAQLATFIDKVRAATGSEKVDIVGHSQGTLVPDYYAKFLDGGKYIDHYVGISPAWHGVGTPLSGQLLLYGAAYGFDPSAVLPIGGFAPQLADGGPFLTKLRQGGVAVPGISYTNIVTKYDELVVPYTSGIEAGMENIVLQDVCAQDFSEHVQIPSSPNVVRLVLNALDPAHAQPVKCRLVLPLNGFVTPLA